MNKKIVNWFYRKYYSSFENNWDNNLFRKNILAALKPTDILLDAGAGAGYIRQMNFKDVAKEVYGADMDERVMQNSFLHHAFIADLCNLAIFEDEKFDVIICNSVIEHIAEPEKFVAEISRVLKKGGVFFGKTPNKFHYVALVAMLTPTSFHKYMTSKTGRAPEDTFSTHYRMNSKNKIKKLFRKNNFETAEIKIIEGPPAYLQMNFILYFFGWMYERIVNLLHLDFLKMVIFIQAQKNL
jgi:2-polyprenyl-3-methyl-5-hydroxy-6-metoxy-1,4-benzoquinol methylase